MKHYIPTNPETWTGRTSDQKHYLHEKVSLCNLEKDTTFPDADQTFAILGYACDEGVGRNQGRTGAVKGPDAIRQQLAKMSNHLGEEIALLDVGTIGCPEGNMEEAQTSLAKTVSQLLAKNTFPILLGGGHDIAYGHYNGIKKFLATKGKNATLGIINFDAHFDLRSNENGNNSGTPFYQISRDCKRENTKFKYMCLGIRKDANIKTLFDTAKELNVSYIEQQHFNLHHLSNTKNKLERFIRGVDYIYTTIDLDGFASAYAPGVSAASPMGFSPDMVLECLENIIDSKKMISLDIAEMNPTYDPDHQTAKLAASLIHFVMHQ
ncbi:formimidoylglutamase [Arenibacter sp. 6A1]|uniref:formimidoylglutamase n=1 Tax=Arenibacter sp. 6A1 TaxID=2720391 RepID=UPI001448347B|nr:formimidoylglutamase [Arenibacter sp. 6A1]NKI25295.1 formimidoylglutamase [Arenibacter sp. 6A1]